MTQSIQRASAYGLFFACLLGALLFHAIPALIAGLLSFTLTLVLVSRIRQGGSRWVISHELAAGLLMGAGSLTVLAALSVGLMKFLAGESPAAMMLMLADTLQQAKHYLPAAIADKAPDSLVELKEMAAHALQTHGNQLASLGKSAVHGLILTLVGWLVGVLAAVGYHAPEEGVLPAYQATWLRLWGSLCNAFSRVALAQSKIALLNASLTAAFLGLAMPAMGWELPYVKTMVLVTFLCGLLPVVGNLISNTLVTVLALSVAFPAAVVALGFLIVSHKLEYLASASIQGHEVGASVWELLIALFAMETLFGPIGMVFAPIGYAFIKAELRYLGWLKS